MINFVVIAENKIKAKARGVKTKPNFTVSIPYTSEAIKGPLEINAKIQPKIKVRETVYLQKLISLSRIEKLFRIFIGFIEVLFYSWCVSLNFINV